MSLNVSVPEAAPVAVGENVTPMVQLAPAARLDPQVLPATAKPVLAVTLVMLRATLWTFFSVTLPAALVLPTVTVPRFSELGETVTGAVLDELPLRLTVCGLPGALSVNVSVPFVVPVAVGENVTPTVQVAAAAMLVPQVLLATAKPAVVVMPVKLRDAF